MGIYLFVIGAFDLKYSGEYNKHAQGWMGSLQCQLVGSLAMLSSEVSVLLLTYMTLEKYFSIVFPFSHHRAGRRQTVSVLAAIWLLGFSLSLVPLWCKESFGNYYGRNGVCFPLQSDLGERPSARGYSTTIYLGEALRTGMDGDGAGQDGVPVAGGGSAHQGLGRALAAELPLPPLVGSGTGPAAPQAQPRCSEGNLFLSRLEPRGLRHHRLCLHRHVLLHPRHRLQDGPAERLLPGSRHREALLLHRHHRRSLLDTHLPPQAALPAAGGNTR